MDDLIVIILTIVIAVVGIINQSRKRNEMKDQQPAEETDSSAGDFWDMIMPDEPEAATEPVKAPPEKMVVNEEPLKQEKKIQYDFDAKKEGASLVKEEMKELLKVKRKTKKARPDFSLRNAVIFSEILNRKYQ